MKKTLLALSLLLLCGASASLAQVHIVYPIAGGTYPIADPGPGVLSSTYFTSSFSVTCDGGQHNVEWGFDSTSVGTATFYDMFSAQFVHKLPGGSHIFWVSSNCGYDDVKFDVGN